MFLVLVGKKCVCHSCVLSLTAKVRRLFLPYFLFFWMDFKGITMMLKRLRRTCESWVCSHRGMKMKQAIIPISLRQIACLYFNSFKPYTTYHYQLLTRLVVSSVGTAGIPSVCTLTSPQHVASHSAHQDSLRESDRCLLRLRTTDHPFPRNPSVCLNIHCSWGVPSE